MSRVVLLLKSAPRVVDDPYQILLETEGYHPVFVEIIESALSNEKKLLAIVSSGPHGMYRGVVVTSSRAAEGWIRALEHTSSCGDWSDIPFYVLGESTAHALEPMTLSHPTKFSKLLILGAHTGKVESLTHFISEDLPVRHTAGRLLYLTGDKNRDAFCRIMHEHDVPIENLMEYFSLPQTGRFSGALRPATLAAIGTTTSEFLTNQAHLRVDAVPIKPTAEHLIASIKEFDKQSEVASR